MELETKFLECFFSENELLEGEEIENGISFKYKVIFFEKMNLLLLRN